MKCPKEVSSFVVRFSVKVQGLLLPFCQVLSMPDANLYIAAPGPGSGSGSGSGSGTGAGYPSKVS